MPTETEGKLEDPIPGSTDGMARDMDGRAARRGFFMADGCGDEAAFESRETGRQLNRTGRAHGVAHGALD